MQIRSSLAAAGLTACFISAQTPDGSPPRVADDPRILLDYASFDPHELVPNVPPRLAADASVSLFIVQFRATPTDADRDAVRAAGAAIKGYLPHDCHIVQVDSGAAMQLYALPQVRWVGAYQPAYRLEPFLLQEHLSGRPAPRRDYNMVMVDKRNDKAALAAKVEAIGGEIVDRHEGGLLFTASFNAQQLLAAAKFDEVLYIDRATAVEEDMDNVRVQGGADYIETVAGYTGLGIRGHVYEGVEAAHPDFNTPFTQVGPGTCAGATSHGHCTAGIVFGNGASATQARGLAPDAVGFYTRYVGSTNSTCATSPARNAIIGTVVNTHQCMFTTASWGNTRTFFYTSVSADADDIVFDHRIPWTQSQSNAGNQDSRPQAWAKNVISVGGVFHGNNSTAADDSWSGGGSTGPAQDGRNKPDLAAYYDQVWTSDRVGALGYTSTNSYTNFNGTSAATPIVAGHNALAIQMYTDHIFDVAPRVPGGTRFENRPYAQTVKALQVACANMYTPTATNNRREHVGYGFPSLQTMWDNRDRISIVPEDVTITQGATRTFQFEVDPGTAPIKFVMTYLDPAGNPAAAFDRVNDLTMRVTNPNGVQYWGNQGLDGAGQTNQSSQGGSADTRDTMECVIRNNPVAGVWTVEISAPTLTVDANPATSTTDATFALVVNGARRVYGSGCAEYLPDTSPSSTASNYFPFGGYTPSDAATLFASNNGGATGGAVFFDVATTQQVWIHSLEVNTSVPAGEELRLDVYSTVSSGTSYAGLETNPAAWAPYTFGKGVSAGPDAPSKIYLSRAIFVNSSRALAIVANNFNHRYTNGANSLGSSVVTINTGSASNTPFAGSVFSPRTANIALNYRPATSFAQNMRYQTVLRSGELGGPGAITDLSFSARSTGRHYSQSMVVKMRHVPAGYTLSANMENNVPSSTGGQLVANDHTFDYLQDSWAPIGLAVPFNYDGTSDVVVEIVSRGNMQTTTGIAGMGAFNADPNRARVVAAAWTGNTPTAGTIWPTNALRMRVEFGCANATRLGSSCGTLESDYSGSGELGSSFTFGVTGATPNLIAVLGVGFTPTLPSLNLTPFGYTNCLAVHSSVALLTQTTDASGAASYVQPIPSTAALAGSRLFGQWIGLDSSEPGNLTFSNTTRVTLGANAF